MSYFTLRLMGLAVSLGCMAILVGAFWEWVFFDLSTLGWMVFGAVAGLLWGALVVAETGA